MYSEGELVALMDTSALMDILAEESVSTVGGSLVTTSEFRGNPRNGTLAPTEPFLYLNLYGTGGATFDQVKLIGGGFEFDNIAVSDRAQVPGSTEIGIQFIAGENEPPAEPLAKTGADGSTLLGLGLAAAVLTVAAVALRRKSAIV
jgi:LPXTG-motif cell wall-anchored protein